MLSLYADDTRLYVSLCESQVNVTQSLTVF